MPSPGITIIRSHNCRVHGIVSHRSVHEHLVGFMLVESLVALKLAKQLVGLMLTESLV